MTRGGRGRRARPAPPHRAQGPATEPGPPRLHDAVLSLSWAAPAPEAAQSCRPGEVPTWCFLCCRDGGGASLRAGVAVGGAVSQAGSPGRQPGFSSEAFLLRCEQVITGKGPSLTAAPSVTLPCLSSEGRGKGRSVGTKGSRENVALRPGSVLGPWDSGPNALSTLPRRSQGNGGLGWAAPGEPAAPLASPSLKPRSLSRGLLAMGFLDPIQTPFNYPRQTAVLVVGGNQIRVPGDSGSRGTAALPASEEGSFPSPTPRGARLPGTGERA